MNRQIFDMPDTPGPEPAGPQPVGPEPQEVQHRTIPPPPPPPQEAPVFRAAEPQDAGNPPREQHKKSENRMVTFIKDICSNRTTWKLLKGMLVIIIALKVAHEFDLLSIPYNQYVPFREFNWANFKEYFHAE